MKFRYLILSAMAVLAISCGKEEYTLSGTGEKTPLEISVSLDDSYGKTKAVNGTFEVDDKLYAYVQQVARSGAQAPYTYTSKIAELVEFTVGQAGSTVVTDKLGTVLYWDDFSSDDDDIRDDDRWLRVEYGFCFNGNSGFSNISIDANGAIADWSVASDQSAAASLKQSDLLWANHNFVSEQDPGKQAEIKYVHTVGDREPLPVVYKHAMSKVTIEVNLGDGFGVLDSGKAKDFGSNNTTPKLFVNKKCPQVKASDLTITSTDPASGDAGVVMFLSDDEATRNKTRVYEAIIAPTLMKAGKKLATIEVGGNKYDITLTGEMLSNKYPAESSNATWSSQLKNYTSDNGGITLPGVNYKLVVNLKKQQIEVSASVVDWDNVTAGAEGEIKFDSDVTTTGVIADALKTDGFDVYKNSVNTAFETKTTTVTWDDNESKWLYTPVIYWAGQSDYSYFRALYPKGSTTEMSQGSDILWGYACDDVTANGSKVGTQDELKINPRTGNVPLTFEHAMSKISVVLKTSTGDDKVDLTDAKISIINLYDGGTLNLVNGNTETLVTKTAEPFTIKDATQISGQVVIPQSLTKLAGGSERGDTPTFYQTSELTKIYDNGTSLPAGGGEGTYYLTSTLDQVKYTESELTDIYSNGTSISDGSTFETYVTATLTHVDAQAAVYYTQTECDEINNPHRIADDHSRAPGDPEYVTTYPADYTPITTETIKTPAVPEHYEVNSNSVKATTSTLKCYKKTSSSEPHTPGELKAKGNKIMMYVTLKNGSRYSIEMSKCITSDSNLITEWKRGEHYTYEITLGKEQITFRALIKQWDEKAGSGSATLDWD